MLILKYKIGGGSYSPQPERRTGTGLSLVLLMSSERRQVGSKGGDSRG